MSFQHNSKTVANEPQWSNVDKTELPRIAFADPGEADKKSTWGYPHHFVENGGDPDHSGILETGTLYLHRGGLNAAWAAANGAHTGNKASQAVLDHLQAHRKALGLDKPRGSAQSVERRMLDVAEIRVDGEAGAPKQIRGYAAVFNAYSQPMMGFRELIRPGAFKKTLREADVRALMNHDPNCVLGRKSAGTLTLAEDDKGLRYSIDPPNTSFANDLMVSIGRGDVTQSSFGFQTVKDKWGQDGQVLTRELIEVKLFDVSPVTYPAYTQTEASVRSLCEYLEERACGEAGPEEEQAAIRHLLEQLTRWYQSEPALRHSETEREEPGRSAHSHDEIQRALRLMRRHLDVLMVS